MKGLKTMALGMSALLIVSCGSNMKNGALIGAGGGAALGAIVGKIAGNTGLGAAIGVAAGTTAGILIGKHMDKVKEQAAQVPNAQVEEVTDANGLKAVKLTFDSGLLFPTSSSTLQESSKKSLSELATVMKNNTDADIAIQGYTDNTGWKNSTAEQSAQKNQDLSVRRAQAVYSYLTGLGVQSKQVKSVDGFGETNPVADNSTVAGKAQNRRVEVYMYASEEMIKAANNGTLN